MGIQINGQNDTVSASDGSINISGEISATVLNQTVTGVTTFSDATFTNGFNVTGVVTATGINASGVITATSFSGDGSGLSGIDASSLKSGGVVKVQANSSGAVVTGVVTTGNAFIKDSAVGLGTTSSTGRDAGIGTATGTLIYLPASGLQIYTGDDGGWKTVADTDEIRSITVTGGTVTTSGDNRIHTFTSDGTFTTDGNITGAQLLVIAGGGGGGGAVYGAGGGAGGVAYSTGMTIPGASYTATVGPGGAGGPSSTDFGTTGTDSTFGSAPQPAYRIAKGGGGAGSYVPAPSGDGKDGGSGGGACAIPGLSGGSALQPSQNPGVPVTNSGFRGGNYTQSGGGYAPTGGGGAGAQGGDTPDGAQGGRPGGVGIEYSISGTPVYYAGGGGASIYATAGPAGNGSGGNGGGGNGGNANNGLNGSSPGINGVDGKGGGGGGAHTGVAPQQNSTTSGGSGGKGVIIVSYPTVDNNVNT